MYYQNIVLSLRAMFVSLIKSIFRAIRKNLTSGVEWREMKGFKQTIGIDNQQTGFMKELENRSEYWIIG